ncbi:Holliday junction resolvase RecU [Tyzzerella sp. OttesenSCG-928-J15]|nr:Holliday junction resolvase RecU [Tyzzerella sp. OttesenSCG-928-J15]
MGYWNTRGLRGSTFENMINMTNEVYENKNLAIIQKIPTPITPVSIDKSRNAITLGYFEKKSTVDYSGVVQGVPICFDAKETNRKYLPLQNIHAHQMEFMEKFEKQQGVAFFLVSFTLFDTMYYLPFTQLKIYWDKAGKGGRKSIPHEDFVEKAISVTAGKGVMVHYLEALKFYLEHY